MFQLNDYQGQHMASSSLVGTRTNRIFDLFQMKAMRRITHYLLAVILRKVDLRQLDLLMRNMMEDGLDGRLRTSYVARTPYISVEKEDLIDILTNEMLPSTIYELEIRFEDDRRSIEVILSPTAVKTRVIGGADDEYWEESKHTRLDKFLREKRAKFLIPLLSPVPCLFGGAMYIMYLMVVGSTDIGNRMLAFYGIYIVTCFLSAVVFWLHNTGIGLPHAKIVLRPDDANPSNRAVLLLNILSLILQLVRIFIDYFSSTITSLGKLLRRETAYFLSLARPERA